MNPHELLALVAGSCMPGIEARILREGHVVWGKWGWPVSNEIKARMAVEQAREIIRRVNLEAIP